MSRIRFVNYPQAIEQYIRQNPKSLLGEIVGILGIHHVVKLIEKFGGETLNIPSPKALERSYMPIFLREHLARKKPKNKKRMIKSFSKIYKISKKRIEQMIKSGNYEY